MTDMGIFIVDLLDDCVCDASLAVMATSEQP